MLGGVWSGPVPLVRQGDARLIARDDLLGSLDRAAAGKVTIISAPAGSGKLSLLRAWAVGRGAPRLAVVQVHRDQRDAQDFWLALLDAVRGAAGTDANTSRQQRHPVQRSRDGRPDSRSSPPSTVISRWSSRISTT